MKLYKVKCRGMKNSATSTLYGDSYVMATDPTSAYKIVKEYLDERDLGFLQDRELESIELLAEEGDYPICRIQLHIAKKN